MKRTSIPAELENARAAKKKVAALLAKGGIKAATGLARSRGALAVKVNLSNDDTSVSLPPEVFGVDIVVEKVGAVRMR